MRYTPLPDLGDIMHYGIIIGILCGIAGIYLINRQARREV